MRDFDTCDEKSFRDFSGNFSNRVKFRKKGSQINQKVLHKGVAAKKGNTGVHYKLLSRNNLPIYYISKENGSNHFEKSYLHHFVFTELGLGQLSRRTGYKAHHSPVG